MSVTEICNELDQEQSKISHNLKCLSGCHLIDCEQRGKQRIYSLNKDTMVPLMEIVEKHVKAHCDFEHCPMKQKEDHHE